MFESQTTNAPFDDPAPLRTDDDLPPTPLPPLVREGLPRDYRMRADAHYVDLLDAPTRGSDPTHAAEALRADAREADAALAQSLAALNRCAAMPAGPGSRLTQRVIADLTRAELWRANCLLQWARMLRGEMAVSRRAMEAHELFARVIEALDPEIRLRGVVLSKQVTLSHGTMHVDPDLVVSALCALIMGTLGIMDDARPQVTISARRDPGGDFTFSLAQESASIPTAWLAASDEPGSGEAGKFGRVAFQAARRILDACGGRVSIAATGRSTAVHVTIPSV